MRRMLTMAALALVAVACVQAPGDPPPRHFMQGGVWYPAATGYWFHQYAVEDDLERLMPELGFECRKSPDPGTAWLRCERGFRVPGLLWRTDFAEFQLRRNGAIALAWSGCRFAFFGSEKLGGSCTPYMAKGAVYPDIETFAAMAEAMLRPTPIGQPTSIFRLPPKRADAPPRDAEALVDQLEQWRFECVAPRRRSTTSFRGNVGKVYETTCQQWSLRVQGTTPQSQQVIIRYDSLDLAVLDVTVRLDGIAAVLTPSLHTPRAASGSTVAPALALETVTGERIDMPWSAIGTGSGKQTREGFLTLTPESQRALVQAYLDKQEQAWGRPPEKLAQAYLGSLEWYGPDALPHIDALASDERPDLGAAILKYRCLEISLPGMSPDGEAATRDMATCIDERRAAMPRSLAVLDRLLANELRTIAGMDAGALNANFDFRRDVMYAIALGPDGKESAAALVEVTAGKQGLEPRLAQLVARALAQQDRYLKPR
jgi:hypothetical protein